MKKKQKTAAELKSIFTEMDKRTKQAEQDFEALLDFAKRFKTMQKNLSVLQKYYTSDWMEDVAQFEKKVQGASFYSIGEDPIWNVTQDFYFEKIKLIKTLANSL